MKKVLLALLLTVPFTAVQSQNCEPDPFYADSVGVFPLPYDEVNSPLGGIDECAVIGENYKYTLTIAVSDSITAEVFGSEVTLPLDKVIVDSVKGLPNGLNYVCEPVSCEYEKNSVGCAAITGVPTSDNAPGDYSLTIYGTAVFPIFPFTYNLTFPGVLAEGEYIIRLLASADDNCGLVSTKEQLSDKIEMTVAPNPVSGLANIKINADIFGEFDLHVVDLLGQSVDRQVVRLHEGKNNYTLETTQLANGFYFLVLENEVGRMAQKVTIQH